MVRKKESNDLIITLVLASNVVLDFGEIFLGVGISNHDTYHCQSWSSRIIAQQVGVRNAGGSSKVIVEDSTLTPLNSMPFQDKLQNALGEQHPSVNVLMF